LDANFSTRPRVRQADQVDLRLARLQLSRYARELGVMARDDNVDL